MDFLERTTMSIVRMGAATDIYKHGIQSTLQQR